MPRTMLATSTHDTKRGEDARARIAALARHAGLWGEKVREWHRLLTDPRHPVDRNEEYFFYQLLLGAWPAEWRPDDEIATAHLQAFADRVEAAMLKSSREAGVNTRWVFGDPGYEAALAAFVGRALAPGGRFLGSFRTFEAAVAPDAAQISLAQVVLKLTVPGVPDIYQGAELWDQSMVDPDNRRPVDFGRRADLLEHPALPGAPTDARAKLAAIRRLLRLRRSNPRLFAEGSYQPLPVEGPAAVCAFARLHDASALVVAVALHGLPAGAAAASRIALPLPPGRSWSPVLTDADPLRSDVASLDRSPLLVLYSAGRVADASLTPSARA
jgi:(1->4)-alpha-D-glucan 1-alpha-D-glucosylmutase